MGTEIKRQGRVWQRGVGRPPITSQPIRPKCQWCGTNWARRKRKTILGYQSWERWCQGCQRRKAGKGSAPKTHRKRVGSCCSQCGWIPKQLRQLHVDHVIPRSLGGTNRPENLQTLCPNCHSDKTLEDGSLGPPRPRMPEWMRPFQRPLQLRLLEGAGA